MPKARGSGKRKPPKRSDIAASRAAGNPVVDVLRKSGVIAAAELQDALMRQSVLRSHEADAGLSLAQHKAARRAAQERAEHVAADFSRAQKAVLRVEFSLEAAEKIDR